VCCTPSRSISSSREGAVEDHPAGPRTKRVGDDILELGIPPGEHEKLNHLDSYRKRSRYGCGSPLGKSKESGRRAERCEKERVEYPFHEVPATYYRAPLESMGGTGRWAKCYRGDKD
jgi:hypothetical protein